MEAQESAWRSRSATACAWFVGLVFLATGFAKAYDIYGFIEKATYYRAVEARFMLPVALGTIALELLLGWALCMRLYPKVVSGVAIGVTVGFSVLIAYAWRTYGIEDCGCLGSVVDTPPGASLAKNGILILASLWVFGSPGKACRGTRLLGGVTSSLLLAAGCMAMVASQI